MPVERRAAAAIGLLGLLLALTLAPAAAAAPGSPTLKIYPLDYRHSLDGSTDVEWDGSAGADGYRCAVVPRNEPAPAPEEATPCASPWNTGPLEPGTYDMWLWAFDEDGFSEPAEAPFYAYIDGVAAISGTPADGAVTNDPAADLSIELTNPEDIAKDAAAGGPDSGFVCQLDGAPVPGQIGLHPYKENPDWSRCREDVPLTLADGTHTFLVHHRIRVGGAAYGTSLYGPIDSRTFTVDTQPPETVLDRGLVRRIPVDPGGTASLTFGFSGADPAPGTPLRFECRLDGGVWASCSGSQREEDLELGEHRFAVRAVDAAGNADPTPAIQRVRAYDRAACAKATRRADGAAAKVGRLRDRLRRARELGHRRAAHRRKAQLKRARARSRAAQAAAADAC